VKYASAEKAGSSLIVFLNGSLHWWVNYCSNVTPPRSKPIHWQGRTKHL